MHIGVGAGVDERNVKDHFLAARHECHDVSAFSDAGAEGTGAPRGGAASSSLRRRSDRGSICLGRVRRWVVRKGGGRC